MVKKTRKKRRKIIIISIIVIIIVIGIGVKMMWSGEKPIEVQTEKVRLQKIIHKVTASGKLLPEIEVNISANISAIIMEITVKEGDSVRMGQHLISLDRTRYEAALEQTYSQLKSAKASLVEATARKVRAEELYSEQLISSQDLESVIANFELAESQVELAGAALKTTMDDLSKTMLLAPRTGIVTQIHKEAGEQALGSIFQADVLMTIADLSKIEVVVEVNENDVVDVSVGDTTEIEIDAIQDSIFYGVVKEISQVATTTALGTQEQVTNFDVKIRMLEVPESIRQGMSATASIITDIRENVPAIPIQALTVRSPKPEWNEGEELSGDPQAQSNNQSRSRRNGDGSWKKQKLVEVVFVLSDTIDTKGSIPDKWKKVKGDFFTLQRKVKVGLSSETHYEVLSGLREGDEIIIGSYKAISRELENNTPVIKKQNGNGENRNKWRQN